MMTRLKLVLMSAAVAAAALALAASAHDNASAGAQRHPVKARSAAAAFSVLSRAATAADEDNAAVRASAASDLQLLPDRARVLSTSAEGELWLIPERDGGLCLAEQPPPGSGIVLRNACVAGGDAASEGIVAGVPGHIYGVVPDGVDSVEAVASDGTSRSIVASNGAYRAPDGAVGIRFHGPDGPHSVRLPNAP